MARIEVQYLRVLKPGEHAVLDPESDMMIVPDATKAYRSDHPLVRAYPWLFAADSDAVEETR